MKLIESRRHLTLSVSPPLPLSTGVQSLSYDIALFKGGQGGSKKRIRMRVLFPQAFK
jgi:hypothetical protein